jgi:5-formyltetrahydrofolate cyclo-ligase
VDLIDASAFADKSALRKHLRAVRNALSVAQRQRWTAELSERVLGLAEVRQAETVFCYVSKDDEVGSHDLIDRLIAAGKKLWIPRTETEGLLALPFTGWQAMKPGQLGILEPRGAAGEARNEFDVTLTPGLGFSQQGDRIGYGAGYYDRWFSRYNGGLRVGLTYTAQLVEAMPVDERDIAMHVVVTQDSTIEVDRR